MRLMHTGRDFAMLCAQQDTTWFLVAHVAAAVLRRPTREPPTVRPPAHQAVGGLIHSSSPPSQGQKGFIHRKKAIKP
ncbi:MAG: hypothetical protein M3O50_20525 [Myxococcota bacterium]|nr:hypothetical protein [Myxococcota bacterium]